MDMRFDQFCAGGPSKDAGDAAAALDWPGLAARLAAAHAARRSLVGDARPRMARGSFAPALALEIAARRELRVSAEPVSMDGFRSRFPCGRVNQTAKAGGKPPGAIAANGKGEGPCAV